MTSDHHHGPGDLPHGGGTPAVPAVVDRSISDSDLTPADLSRRDFLRRAGLFGAGATVLSVAGPSWLGGPRPARAATNDASYLWLAGDHHIHTQYSIDAQYRVDQQVQHGASYGLDWMVITDHGRDAHEKVAIDKIHPDIVAARQQYPAMLVYQGLEWNIPAAEHGTVFFAPGPNEVDLLRAFESSFDGVILEQNGTILRAAQNDPSVEQYALQGLRWIAQAVAAGEAPAGLFLANHPARRGLDSPHEIRAWRDAAPSVAVGMEGAPGHQAAGITTANGGPGSARGFYDFAPGGIDAHNDLYGPETYPTYGGFDWMTATVGGLWDSLLAEGRGWWITANSDAHAVYRDSYVRGPGSGFYDDPTSPYYGGYGNPIDTGAPVNGRGDFWPGYYSRTAVGATARDYVAVMDAIRAGRMYVMHGDLIGGIDVRVVSNSGPGVTLGGLAVVTKGTDVTVNIAIQTRATPNFNGDLPRLARVDLIAGPVTGPVSNADTLAAPKTSVIQSWAVSQSGGAIVNLSYVFRNTSGPFYFRLRGTDGRASATGSIEPRVDPVGIDPWTDLWFYTNPIFVDVV